MGNACFIALSPTALFVSSAPKNLFTSYKRFLKMHQHRTEPQAQLGRMQLGAKVRRTCLNPAASVLKQGYTLPVIVQSFGPVLCQKGRTCPSLWCFRARPDVYQVRRFPEPHGSRISISILAQLLETLGAAKLRRP